jgi:hypothetical protein
MEMKRESERKWNTDVYLEHFSMSKNKSNGFTNWCKACECKESIRSIMRANWSFVWTIYTSGPVVHRLVTIFVIVLQLCPYMWYTAVPKHESIVIRNLLNPNKHTHTSFRYRIASFMVQILCIQWEPNDMKLQVELWERELYHWPRPGSWMKNMWGPNFIPTYAIMAWCLTTRWLCLLHYQKWMCLYNVK